MKCFECWETGELQHHHVVPRSKGGTATVLLCLSCHAVVHSRRRMAASALTSAALQHKKAQGEYTGGKVPYGQQVASCGVMLEENPAEQAVIKVVIEYRAAGLSLRKVADRLEERGFTTRKGGKFAANQVRRIEKAAK